MFKGKRTEEAEELNLVPIMNLVTILIPFLLMASSFVTLAAIDSSLPAINPDVVKQPTEVDSLDLAIAITNDGWRLSGTGIAEDTVVRCLKPGCPTADSYDRDALTRVLSGLKDSWPDEENVILVPERQIEYAVLVWTMDAVRDDPNDMRNAESRVLFPYAVIAGGAQ